MKNYIKHFFQTLSGIMGLIFTLSWLGIGSEYVNEYFNTLTILLIVGVIGSFIMGRLGNKISINDLERKMLEEDINVHLANEILSLLHTTKERHGEKEFDKIMRNLNFRVPEELLDENRAIYLYGKYQFSIEEVVDSLEQELQLSWEVQTEDIQHLDEKARKVQLAVGQKLTDAVHDLLN
ncbi:hypothetical protein QA612_05540 [Evansella sp. AB-P1]|uniref:hypothetical protein n=1 Tax=Evansella sp. AB-P1 TaxID=3037653 RepID=UPI00241EA164|nr:hypothetical protein [Evansella sp. AB-P1]MDG5786947.1 hypothetical protein [Evansella sp. AB-P1]